MTDNTKVQRVREGYQPKAEQARGYPVTQPVDLSNLQIPENLGDAAVNPTGAPQPQPSTSDKE